MELMGRNMLFNVFLASAVFVIGKAQVEYFDKRSQPLLVQWAPIEFADLDITLFTRSSLDGRKVVSGDNNSLKTALFDPSKPIVIVTHGFEASKTTKGQVTLRKAHMDVLDINYFIVDWSKCSDSEFFLYPIAANCALKVGGYIADFIYFLTLNGGDINKMQLIGHSLGSHAVSQVSNYGIRLPRITGLDPTQVLFTDRPEPERLDPSDAAWVDIIHTNVNLQGWNKRLGHADFFPNGGDFQPICPFYDLGCDHESAYDYYSRSLYQPMRYPGRQCSSLTFANLGLCGSGGISYMGVLSPKGLPGLYYVEVTSSS